MPYSDVIGRYAGHLPKVGLFFNFLKTTPGYLLCIFLPFALLILSQAVQTVRLFRAYRREQAGAGDSDAFALPSASGPRSPHGWRRGRMSPCRPTPPLPTPTAIA